MDEMEEGRDAEDEFLDGCIWGSVGLGALHTVMQRQQQQQPSREAAGEEADGREQPQRRCAAPHSSVSAAQASVASHAPRGTRRVADVPVLMHLDTIVLPIPMYGMLAHHPCSRLTLVCWSSHLTCSDSAPAPAPWYTHLPLAARAGLALGATVAAAHLLRSGVQAGIAGRRQLAR